MITKKRILLAVDTSDHSMQSVKYVATAFSPHQTEVVIFHIYSQIEDFFSSLDISLSPYNFKINDLFKTHQQAIQQFMDNARTLLVSSGFSESTITIKTNLQQLSGIAEEIYNESKENYHAVVVGRTGISQLNEFIGNTAASLINLIKHIPLIIVDDIPKSHKILIAYDGSATADRAVQCVGDLLAHTTYEVLIYHVIKALKYSLMGIIEISREFEKDYMQKQYGLIQKKMNMISNELLERGLAPERLTQQIDVDIKSRAQVILQKSKQEDYSTIVVGRRGTTSIAETIGIGTVGRKVTSMASNRTVWIVN
jgi:nucleotide-binding universal stress UspA family protein